MPIAFVIILGAIIFSIWYYLENENGPTGNGPTGNGPTGNGPTGNGPTWIIEPGVQVSGYELNVEHNNLNMSGQTDSEYTGTLEECKQKCDSLSNCGGFNRSSENSSRTDVCQLKWSDVYRGSRSETTLNDFYYKQNNTPSTYLRIPDNYIEATDFDIDTKTLSTRPDSWEDSEFEGNIEQCKVKCDSEPNCGGFSMYKNVYPYNNGDYNSEVCYLKWSTASTARQISDSDYDVYLKNTTEQNIETPEQYIHNITFDHTNSQINLPDSSYFDYQTPLQLWTNQVSDTTKGLLVSSGVDPNDWFTTSIDKYSQYCNLKTGMMHTHGISSGSLYDTIYTECGNEIQLLQ